MELHIVVLPGDGIGPEVTAEAVRVLQKVAAGRFEVSFEEHLIGGTAIKQTGTPSRWARWAVRSSTVCPARRSRRPACSACAARWGDSPICVRRWRIPRWPV